MIARRLIPMALIMGGFAAHGASPELEMVSLAELASPLAVQLQVPPADLGGAEDFRRLWRDPRFPSVLMRRHGALYAAFRRSGPISNGRTASTVPSDIVYFLGRPTEQDIASVWPDAVRSERLEHTAEAAAPMPAPVVRAAAPNAPRMAHMPTRARRLEALAAKYSAPAE